MEAKLCLPWKVLHFRTQVTSIYLMGECQSKGAFTLTTFKSLEVELYQAGDRCVHSHW